MAPSNEAPRIAGLTYIRKLGSGGFAQVYLYQQKLPHRLVAVKVLNSPVHQRSIREQFIGEVNTMAQFSGHPSIVTIHAADISQDRRPYIVMEYCSKPSLAERVRTEGFTIAEVLRLGIRIASAVETAHQNEIIHQDIKPANILTTEYGWPALTDFGLSSVAGKRSSDNLVGLSVPWAPPEILDDDKNASVQSDIYSLAATLYTMLAGHHPFYQSGPDESVMALIRRIETQPLPPLKRTDVPEALFKVLAQAMAKRPADRPASAASFARSLQRIESELSLSQTPLDLPQAAVSRESSAHAEPTRHRAILRDHSQPPPSHPQPVPHPPQQRVRPHVMILGLIGVIVAIVGGYMASPDNDDTDVQKPGTMSTITSHHVPDPVKEIDYRYEKDGFVTFYWDESEDSNVNAYAWRTHPTQSFQRIIKPEVTLEFEEDAVCIDVVAVAKDGGISGETRKCAAQRS